MMVKVRCDYKSRVVNSRMTEQFLTVEQVAQALQVHLDTVRHWLRTG